MAEAGFDTLEKNQSLKIFSDNEILQIAEKYGTPLFLVDELTLIKKLRVLQNSYSSFDGSVNIAYSMKANFNPAILKVFINENILFDVTSIGELFFFTNSGGKSSNIIYTSVTEEEQEFKKVLEVGGRRFVIGSFVGLNNLISANKKSNYRVNVLIRINPEVDVKAVVRAAYRNSKFGVPLTNGKNDSALALLNRVLFEPNLIFEDFHFHLGSQIDDFSCFLRALDKIELFIQKLRKHNPNLSIKVLDIGGGTPVFYGTSVPKPENIGKLISDKINRMSEIFGQKMRLIVESGRFLSAESSILISRIVNQKVYSDQSFIYVDSGFHLLLDAALLRQAYPQYIVPKSSDDRIERINLAGRLCDTYDIFPISQVSDLRGASLGKLLVFQNVGAYSLVFGMPFHCQTKPGIIMKRINGNYDLIRPQQKIEDLFIDEGGALPF